MIDAHVHLEKGDYSVEWTRPLKEYVVYIEKLKQINFPIRLKFGLEVCYSPEHVIDIAQMKQMYPFDFLVGSIHFIDGWAFSHLKQRWGKDDYDIDKLYEKYYALMLSLINSRLFSGLAHPQSLQCYGAYPQKDFKHIYLQLAQALCSNDMYIEESSGLAINYGDKQLGMNADMLECMVRCNVPILTVSDAHSPQNVGLYIKEMNDLIQSV